MPSNHLHLSISDRIATIELCNPSRHNALGAVEVAQFIKLLGEVTESPQVRVLVITNPEGNTFCAGADLNEIASGRLTSNQFAALPEALANLNIPTIAAVNGSAFGGGAELALACDFRLGIPHMKLRVPPARIGLCYPPSGIRRFVTVLGVTAAKRLLLASEELSGEELLRLGFLSHLVPREQLPATARALAADMATLAPLAVSAMKQLCDGFSTSTLDWTAALAVEESCNTSADLREGLAAVMSRRDPQFQGR